MKTLFQSFKVLLVFSFLTGGLYPFIVTGLASLFWSEQRMGSLLRDSRGVRGSVLLAQKTLEPQWFWPRPSASDYGTIASGASNLAASNTALIAGIRKQQGVHPNLNPTLAPELFESSGSGLDPHLSLAGVLSQVGRICKARHWDGTQCDRLRSQVNANVEKATWGFLGAERVNVNILNAVIEKEAGG